VKVAKTFRSPNPGRRAKIVLEDGAVESGRVGEVERPEEAATCPVQVDPGSRDPVDHSCTAILYRPQPAPLRARMVDGGRHKQHGGGQSLGHADNVHASWRRWIPALGPSGSRRPSTVLAPRGG
jgi:hypothetical protein